MHPNLSDWVFFSPVMRRNIEKAPKVGTYGCSSKNNSKKFPPIDPNIQKFHLRAAQHFFFALEFDNI